MQPTEPNDEERLEELEGDNQTPFQPADPNPGTTSNTTDPVVQSGTTDLPDDHPATDTGMIDAEVYDEGVDGAAEVSDTSGQSAVTGYDPDAAKDEPDLEETL